MTQTYDVLIEPTTIKQRKQLPGHVRQRIKRTIDALAQEPRPPHTSHSSALIMENSLTKPLIQKLDCIRLYVSDRDAGLTRHL